MKWAKERLDKEFAGRVCNLIAIKLSEAPHLAVELEEIQKTKPGAKKLGFPSGSYLCHLVRRQIEEHNKNCGAQKDSKLSADGEEDESKSHASHRLNISVDGNPAEDTKFSHGKSLSLAKRVKRPYDYSDMLDALSGAVRDELLKILKHEETEKIMRNKGRFVASFGWTDKGDLVTEFGVTAVKNVGLLQRAIDELKTTGAPVFKGKSELGKIL